MRDESKRKAAAGRRGYAATFGAMSEAELTEHQRLAAAARWAAARERRAARRMRALAQAHACAR